MSLFVRNFILSKHTTTHTRCIFALRCLTGGSKLQPGGGSGGEVMQKYFPLSRPVCWGSVGDTAGATNLHPGRRTRQGSAGGYLGGDAGFISSGDTSCSLSPRRFFLFPLPCHFRLSSVYSLTSPCVKCRENCKRTSDARVKPRR